MYSLKATDAVLRPILSLPRLSRFAIVIAVLFVGCAAPLRAAAAPPVGRLQEPGAQELRVASVTYRLALANRALCRGAVAPRPGFTLHGTELGCTSNVELVPGGEVNAWADGERVMISAGLLAQCITDADLALVIAHELAHNILRHSQKLAAAGGSQRKAMGLLGSGSAMMRQTEEEADQLAIRMATAAAYDMGQAEAFMSRLLVGRDAASTAGTHPTADRRLKLLRAGIAVAREGTPKSLYRN